MYRRQSVWAGVVDTPDYGLVTQQGCIVQAFVSVNWLLAEEHVDLETELAWDFLDYLMLGTSAAPLRRALTESGLGESIIGGGLSGELRQPTFSLGLKGVDPANAQKVNKSRNVASRMLLQGNGFHITVDHVECSSVCLCTHVGRFGACYAEVFGVLIRQFTVPLPAGLR